MTRPGSTDRTEFPVANEIENITAEEKSAGRFSQVQAVRRIVAIIRHGEMDYEAFRRVCQLARRKAGLVRPSRSSRLPKILPEASLRKFFDAISQTGNLQHEIMLRLLFYTAIRVSELANIQISDVDLDGFKIFIDSGKGDKDRYILFPESFRLTLKSHIASRPHNTYLFESTQRTKFTTRRIRYIVQEYSEIADVHVHPHLLRHQMLTWLTSQGLPDSQIQLISGHASKKSLEIYQHLSLSTVQAPYQRAVKGMEL